MPSLTSNLDILETLPGFLIQSVQENQFLAAAVALLVFLFFVAVALLRHQSMKDSIKTTSSGILIGFLFAIVVEGFLVLSGRTFITEMLAWENPPKPIAGVINKGRERLTNVLGTSVEIDSTNADSGPTIQSVIEDYLSLPPDQADQIKASICRP